jgi:hypothetical protein
MSIVGEALLLAVIFYLKIALAGIHALLDAPINPDTNCLQGPLVMLTVFLLAACCVLLLQATAPGSYNPQFGGGGFGRGGAQ